MDRAYTRGQPVALAALGAMLPTLPHALLLVGPPGVGKTTLALDVAAALLCRSSDPGARPCRSCRGCRMVESGNHPDLHRLRPDGAGAQIGIGHRPGYPPGVRDLIGELALLPIEGGRRVALIEQAHRMNDVAQAALLKTLEEPPAGAVIVLCADEEERLLPTIRSRAARLRLGPVPIRDIESLLADHGVADPPTGARLARIASGRPGIALALARAPEVVAIRGEIARSLIDLLRAPAAERLLMVRDIQVRALDAVRTLDRGGSDSGQGRDGGRRRQPRTAEPNASGAGPSEGPLLADAEGGDAEPDDTQAGLAGRLSAPERRRAAWFVLDVWRDLTRDLLVAGDQREPGHDPTLIDELAAAATVVPVDAAGAFLGRLARAGELLELNIAPELLLDGLVLRWPVATARA
jgi:DNA polymerase III delta' subunit